MYKCLEAEFKEIIRERCDVFERAIDAIEKFKEWINSQRTREIRVFHMGEKLLSKYFKIRGIDLSPRQLLVKAEESLESIKRGLRSIASELNSSLGPADILMSIASKKPANFPAVLSAYKQSIQEAKRVIIEKDVASIPEEELEVASVPLSLRATAEPTLYIPPGKYEVKKVGKLVIFPIKSEEDLKMHNTYMITHIAVRDGFPGKHLLYAWTVNNKSLVRQLIFAPETVEGWSAYVDDIMSEYGYLTSIRDRFLRLHSLLLNAALAIVDIRISLGETGIHDAIKFICREAFLSEEKALSQVLRCVCMPGYQLSKFYGYEKFKVLRSKVKMILNNYFNLKWFHDTILKTGILPMKYLELLILHKAVQHLIIKRVS